MKQSVFLICTLLSLSSCMSAYQIIETNDPYKEINKMKLAFASSAVSEEKHGAFRVANQIFKIHATYLYEEAKTHPPQISLNLEITTPIRAEELDSVIFLILDDEKIRISSTEYIYKEFVSQSNPETTPSSGEKINKAISTEKTATKNENQLMNRLFYVPENLWVSIANSTKIQYRFYIGKEGFDVKLYEVEVQKLKTFFEMAMNKRDASLPPIPEGLKKL